MSTLQLACIFFGVTALGGFGLFALRLRGGNPPIGLAALHGVAAATSLVTLTIAVANGARGGALIALALFGLAALGGFLLLFGFHLRQKLLPIPFVLVHGGVAAVGFIVLLLATF